MLKHLLAAVAAVALAGARPAVACENCDKCPHKVAAADAKKEGDKKPAAACACDKDGKGCKCGPTCKCANCAEHGKKGAAKPEGTKS